MSYHVYRKHVFLAIFAPLLSRIEEASETHPFAEIEAKLDRISEQVQWILDRFGAGGRGKKGVKMAEHVEILVDTGANIHRYLTHPGWNFLYKSSELGSYVIFFFNGSYSPPRTMCP